MDISIPKNYASIEEYKGYQEPNDNVLRVYMSQYPDILTLQIRTFKGINGAKSAKRNMIASLTVSISELEDIVRQAKEYTATK